MSEITCPNCGSVRPNVFCGYCGQNSRDYNDSFWTIVKDAIGEMFELDGRVIRSIRSIFRHPGQLSLAFAENRRANFVNPFRLFMFTTILWFFLFGLNFPTPGDRPEVDMDTSSVVSDESERERPHVPAPVRIAVNIDPEALKESESDFSAGIEILRGHLEGDRARKLDEMLAADEEARRLGPVRGIAHLLNAQPDIPQWLQRLMANVVVDAVHSPQLLINELIDNLPLMMFVLLPWYAILLMLFFGRQGRRFIHHLVFAIHVHSFSFIVLTIGFLTPESGPSADASYWDKAWVLFDQLLFVALMVHTYFAFRRFYGQAHFRTLVKYFSLGFFYLWGLAPAFSLVIVLLLTDYL